MCAQKYISAGTSTAGERVDRGENLRQLSAAHGGKVKDVLQAHYNV